MLIMLVHEITVEATLQINHEQALPQKQFVMGSNSTQTSHL